MFRGLIIFSCFSSQNSQACLPITKRKLYNRLRIKELHITLRSGKVDIIEFDIEGGTNSLISYNGSLVLLDEKNDLQEN